MTQLRCTWGTRITGGRGPHGTGKRCAKALGSGPRWSWAPPGPGGAAELRDHVGLWPLVASSWDPWQALRFSRYVASVGLSPEEVPTHRALTASRGTARTSKER